MAGDVPSLGDEKAKREYVAITDTVELPQTRKDIVASFSRILDLGRVQKVLIELGRPIQFTRLVPKDLILEAQKPLVEDPLDAIRAGDLVDFDPSPLTGPDASRVLFWAFEQLTDAGYLPKYFAVGSYIDLRRWLGLADAHNMSFLYGVPTKKADIPGDTIILAGVNPADPERVAHSIKINLD